MFRFKQFAVRQDRCPMKVGTDGVLLGAWAEVRPGDRRMLDVGTGTGLIALMLAQRSAARITAVDVDAECATQAAENFAASPWADRLDAVAVAVQRYDPVERFDLIVSNPPYIPTDVIPQLMPEVQVFEPIEALDGKEDGLYFYRKIVEQSKDYLNSGGSLMFEIGYDQGKDVSKMMTDAGFSNVCVKKDLAGNDRVVTGML